LRVTGRRRGFLGGGIAKGFVSLGFFRGKPAKQGMASISRGFPCFFLNSENNGKKQPQPWIINGYSVFQNRHENLKPPKWT
jgi:hypothetical protein